jgi:hypothetical protein
MRELKRTVVAVAPVFGGLAGAGVIIAAAVWASGGWPL